MGLKERVKRAEEAISPPHPPREVKVEFIYGPTPEDIHDQILKFNCAGSEDSYLFVGVVKTRDRDGNPVDGPHDDDHVDMSVDQLEAEVEELEARLRVLKDGDDGN